MVTGVLAAVLIGTIALATTIAALTLFMASGKVSNWFFLMMLATDLLLVGHLIEILSTDTDGAFAGVRVLYIGAQMVGPFTLLFIASYCEIELHPWLVRLPLLLAGLVGIVAMWTTGSTQLLYKHYWRSTYGSVHLDSEPAIGYHIIHAIPVVMVFIAVSLIAYRVKTWGPEHRRRLVLIGVVILIPFIGEIVYYAIRMLGQSSFPLYLTPYSLVLADVLLFFGIVRYDVIEIRGIATDRAMDFIAEAFILVDGEHRYITSNSAAKLLFPELQGLSAGSVIRTMPQWPSVLVEAVSSGGGGHSVEYETADPGSPIGQRFFVAEVSKVEVTAIGTKIAWSIVIRDVTEQRASIQQLEEYAFCDPLTGLNNRRHFKDLALSQLLRADRTGTPCHVMMLDLDYFKDINDTYGHLAGDAVLKHCAHVVKNALREHDLVGRHGGEEFVVLVTDATRAEALAIAERIRENVARSSLRYGDLDITTTISIGVAERSAQAGLKQVVDQADRALYLAKHDRNTVVLWDRTKSDDPATHASRPGGSGLSLGTGKSDQDRGPGTLLG
ncbi:MAG: diguanylate cyclase [Micrococcales bacterium]|nr:diguanylate cyclase [Micrococcales bacterium]